MTYQFHLLSIIKKRTESSIILRPSIDIPSMNSISDLDVSWRGEKSQINESNKRMIIIPRKSKEIFKINKGTENVSKIFTIPDRTARILSISRLQYQIFSFFLTITEISLTPLITFPCYIYMIRLIVVEGLHISTSFINNHCNISMLPNKRFDAL